MDDYIVNWGHTNNCEEVNSIYYYDISKNNYILSGQIFYKTNVS